MLKYKNIDKIICAELRVWMLYIWWHRPEINEICKNRRYLNIDKWTILYTVACIPNGCQYVRNKRRSWIYVCWSRCTEIGHQMGERESGSCACVFKVYIVDELQKGIFIFLRVLIDDSDVPFKKLKFQNEFIPRSFWTGRSKVMVTYTGPYSRMFQRKWSA